MKYICNCLYPYKIVILFYYSANIHLSQTQITCCEGSIQTCIYKYIYYSHGIKCIYTKSKMSDIHVNGFIKFRDMYMAFKVNVPANIWYNRHFWLFGYSTFWLKTYQNMLQYIHILTVFSIDINIDAIMLFQWLIC